MVCPGSSVRAVEIILLHHNSPGQGDTRQILVLEGEALQEAGDPIIESILEVFKGTTTQATGVAEAPTQDLEEVSGVISTSKQVLTWVLEAMTGVVSAEGKNLEEGI